MKSRLRGIVFALLFYFLSASHAIAVTKIDGNLKVTLDEPLFSSSVVWYPGLSESRTITVTNLDSNVRSVGLRAVSTSQTGNFADALNFEVKEGSFYVYGGSGSKSMKDFWNEGEITLSSIPSGGTKTYTIIVTMPTSAGNGYQNQTAGFDLAIGLIGTNSEVNVQVPSTSTSSSTNSSGEGGGDGGGTSEVFGIAADSPFSRFVSNVFGIFDSGTSSGEILAEDIQEAEDADDLEETTVLGEQDEICQNASWWWIVILGYGLTSIILLVLGSKLSRIFRVGIHGTATLAAIILLIYALCSWYIAATLVLVLGLASYFLLEGQAQDE